MLIECIKTYCEQVRGKAGGLHHIIRSAFGREQNGLTSQILGHCNGGVSAAIGPLSGCIN
ncbi:MAG: hypothetical protein B0W54_12785 [Cellvibrio sp. 79]|nr:MAG: hypothetical protein B0W54_12785 [Cellvibrio sp. 79]